LAAIVTIDWIFRPTPPVVPLPYLPFFVVFVVCGVWSYKEFERPTLRRTPKWVREEMARDPELQAVVYGKRLG
jgi:hypothetical protein